MRRRISMRRHKNGIGGIGRIHEDLYGTLQYLYISFGINRDNICI